MAPVMHRYDPGPASAPGDIVAGDCLWPGHVVGAARFERIARVGPETAAQRRRYQPAIVTRSSDSLQRLQRPTCPATTRPCPPATGRDRAASDPGFALLIARDSGGAPGRRALRYTATMTDVLITNARVVNEGRVFDADVRVDGGRIEAIGGALAAGPATRVIDAAGRWLLPGLIDDQVHFREPGLEHKADIATETGAAVAGGITSFFEMPNTKPPTITPAALEDKYRRAAGRARANYGFFFGATNDNAAELAAVDPRSTPGFKVFMGASTGNMLVDEPEALARIFAAATLPVATHCEDTPRIRANDAAVRERIDGPLAPHHHPVIRDVEACWRSSSFAVELARRHGTRLHILHLTSARELELFEPGPMADKQITAEACIHHLSFSDADYTELGNRIKCNPAIKTADDRAALRAAVRDGRIDILATDHAPHTREEKAQPYEQAPAGMPLAQELLPGLLELVAQGELTIEQVVEKASHNVARRFDVAERGFIREGYYADLVVADPNAITEVSDRRALAKCGWTPFDGRRLRGRVDCTLVNGVIAWCDGALSDAIAGQRLVFDR